MNTHSAEMFAEELTWDVSPGGKVAGIRWVYDNNDGDVYLDTEGLDSVLFSPDDLREIADEAEAKFGGGEDTDDDREQWNTSGDILLQNSTNTVGLAETSDALKPLSTAAQSVLLTPSLLEEMLDVAVAIGDEGPVWFTVEHERPVLATPQGDVDRLSAVVTPLVATGETNPPMEDI